MKEGKHSRTTFKIIETYSVLIFIAALFMCIGYAEISGVLVNITGTVEATSQEGVFIADVVLKENNNADTEHSKINYYIGTMLDSQIALGNTADSTITYEITLYNNSNEDNVFIDVLTDITNATVYDNENIEFILSGIEKKHYNNISRRT